MQKSKKRESTKLLLLIFSCLGMTLVSSLGAELEPDALTQLPMDKTGIAIRYGYELLAHTPIYLGPNGTVGHYTKNLITCGNCHLQTGTQPNGNSWLDSHSIYPQYRQREGTIQTLADRVNTCLTHNLVGRPLPENGPEMRAILLYMKWIGEGQTVRHSDPDQRLPALAFLDRAANLAKGLIVYQEKCASCHGQKGEGRLRVDGKFYEFPPLWGNGSFSWGTSMSRLSILARFVRANMPYQAAPENKLKDEEAWDVSAFVLSHHFPKWSGATPFKDLLEKPFDYPIGPYADPFPREQHLLGPFKPILDFLTEKMGSKAALATSGV